MPTLPISMLMLAISLFVVEKWRPAAKMAVVAFSTVLIIGALYFVPLVGAHAIQRNHENGAPNKK
jgi:hypothetical protein